MRFVCVFKGQVLGFVYLPYVSGTSKEKLNLTTSTTYDWEIRSACSTDSSAVSAWSSTQSFTTASPCTVQVNLMH